MHVYSTVIKAFVYQRCWTLNNMTNIFGLGDVLSDGSGACFFSAATKSHEGITEVPQIQKISVASEYGCSMRV